MTTQTFTVIISSVNKHTQYFDENPCKEHYYVKQVSGNSVDEVLRTLIKNDQYFHYYIGCKYHTDYVIVEQMVVDPQNKIHPILDRLYEVFKDIGIEIWEEIDNDLENGNEDEDSYFTEEKLLKNDPRVKEQFTPEECTNLYKYFKDSKTYSCLIDGLWNNMCPMSKIIDSLNEDQFTKLVEVLKEDDIISVKIL